MVRAVMLVGLALLLAAVSPLAAQEAPTRPAGPEDLDFKLGRGKPGRGPHPSETPKYRELGIGDLGFAFAAFYTARSYNISDIRKLDHSLANSWLHSFDPWGLGARIHAEYRLSNEWYLSLIQRADVAFGLLNTPHHETFSFYELPFTQNYPASNDNQKLSVNLELEFSVRWRWLWFTAKANSWMVFRKTEVRGRRDTFVDGQLGTLDSVKDRKRTDWDNAFVYGASTGVGFDFFFVDESARFIVFAMWRPFNVVRFRDATGITNGLEFIVRSADFDLTDQAGIYFEASAQMYLPTDEFNDIYYSQFSFGIRWR